MSAIDNTPMNRRVALITGGASGIGLASARMIGSADTAVVLMDRDRDRVASAVRELQREGVDAYAEVTDVCDEESVASSCSGLLAQHGRVDVLVNNAGFTGPARAMWETPLSFVRQMLDVHLIGAYLVARELVPGMIERGYGRIVNVSSMAGKEGNANSSAYSAAKAGLIGLTKSLGKELATTGVLVNSVAPGVIATDLETGHPSPDHIQRLVDRIPMGRRGRPEEVAELIAWLASERCSFSTGAVYDVSGGRATY